MTLRRLRSVIPALLIGAGSCVMDLPRPATAAEAAGSYRLEEGETHEGDLYLFSGRIVIAGRQEGDLTLFAQALEVAPTGTVTGDVNAWGQSIELDGTVEDSVRVFAQSFEVNGTIKGDLIAFCGTVTVGREAHITGKVKAGGAEVEILGTVDGSVDATGGEIVVEGSIGGDADLEADILTIEPVARIAGDLDYTSRNHLDLAGEEIVGGEITYTPEKKRPPVTTGEATNWFFFMITALVVGLAALGLFRRRAPAIVSMVRRDTLRSGGVGFISLVVVPVAAVFACILIITIPLVVIALLLFAVLVYIAKVPVAIWLGDTILRGIGRPDRSPFLALTVGIPVLYLIFSLPFLGGIAWFVTLFVGLGAIVLSSWRIRQESRPSGAAPPPHPSPPPAAQASPGPASS